MLKDERERDVFQGGGGLFMLAVLIHEGGSADLAKLKAHQLVVTVNWGCRKVSCHSWEDT